MTPPMLVLLVVLWLSAATLLAIGCYGPRRWHTRVTSQVRPEAAEPTEDGYYFLSARTWLLLLVAICLAAPLTFEVVHISENELYAKTRLAVDLIGDVDVSATRIEAQVEVLLHRDVTLVEVTQSEAAESDPAAETRSSFDVVVDDVDSDVSPDELGGAIVCVTISTRNLTTGFTSSVNSTSTGRCEE